METTERGRVGNILFRGLLFHVWKLVYKISGNKYFFAWIIKKISNLEVPNVKIKSKESREFAEANISSYLLIRMESCAPGLTGITNSANFCFDFVIFWLLVTFQSQSQSQNQSQSQSWLLWLFEVKVKVKVIYIIPPVCSTVPTFE